MQKEVCILKLGYVDTYFGINNVIGYMIYDYYERLTNKKKPVN